MYKPKGQEQITPGEQKFCDLKFLLLWSHIASFNHKALIQFEKMIFQHLPHINVYHARFKGQMSSQDYHLSKVGRPWVPGTTY